MVLQFFKYNIHICKSCAQFILINGFSVVPWFYVLLYRFTVGSFGGSFGGSFVRWSAVLAVWACFFGVLRWRAGESIDRRRLRMVRQPSTGRSVRSAVSMIPLVHSIWLALWLWPCRGVERMSRVLKSVRPFVRGGNASECCSALRLEAAARLVDRVLISRRG